MQSQTKEWREFYKIGVQNGWKRSKKNTQT
jgi:hypothetical protein